MSEFTEFLVTINSMWYEIDGLLKSKTWNYVISIVGKNDGRQVVNVSQSGANTATTKDEWTGPGGGGGWTSWLDVPTVPVIQRKNHPLIEFPKFVWDDGAKKNFGFKEHCFYWILQSDLKFGPPKNHQKKADLFGWK